MKQFTLSEVFSFGWNKVKQHFWFIIAATFIAYALTNILREIFVGKEVEGIFEILLSIVLWIIGLIFTVGYFRILLRLSRNEPATFKNLYSDEKISTNMHGWLVLNYFVASLLICLSIIIGLVFLIIPGIYFAVTFSLAVLIVVDTGKGPIEAMKESARLTKGYKWKLLGYGVVGLLLNIAGAILLLVGLLVTIPITMFAMVYVYQKLKDQEKGELATSGPQNPTISTPPIEQTAQKM